MMKAIIQFHAPPTLPKATPTDVDVSAEPEDDTPETVPLDPEFLAWLEELL